MPTANDLGTAALRLLGVVEASETPPAADLEFCFTRLNDWIDSLGTERLIIYALARTEKALTSGTQSYTIGSGGDIAIVRPLWIDAASILLDDTVSPEEETPIQVLSDQEWQRLGSKDLTSTGVTAIYYDHGFDANQRGTIYVWPIPTVETISLILYTPTALTQFATQATSYVFPPAYRRAILHNLVIEIAPAFNREVPPTILRSARESLDQIKRANYRPAELAGDPMTGGMRRPFNVVLG